MSEFNGNVPSSPQGKFWYWMEERERVRMKKEAGFPKPWSLDPVFQRTYFCNVNREDDRVTRWIRTHWNRQHPNYEFAMCAARLFNWPTTLEVINFPFDDVETWIKIMIPRLKQRQAEGLKVWGNAYVVTTHGQRMDKLDYAQSALRTAAAALVGTTLPGTLSAAHSAIQAVEGFGSFMAAQVVADLKNTAWHHLANADDWWEFSAHGPGSLRGLTWYYGEKITPRKYQGAMEELMEDFLDVANVNPFLQKYIKPILCAQNLQNCLCEYDKYMRVSTGTGRSKRRYHAY